MFFFSLFLVTIDVNDPLSVSMTLDEGIRDYFSSHRGYSEDATLSNVRLGLAAFSVAVCAALYLVPGSVSENRVLILFLAGFFILLQSVYSLVATCLQGSVIFQGRANTKKGLPAIDVSSSKNEKYSEEFTVTVATKTGKASITLPLTKFFTYSGVFLDHVLVDVLDATFPLEMISSMNGEVIIPFEETETNKDVESKKGSKSKKE